MDFELPEELQIIKRTMREFVNRELIPLEREYRPEGEEMPAASIEGLVKVEVRDAPAGPVTHAVFDTHHQGR